MQNLVGGMSIQYVETSFTAASLDIAVNCAARLEFRQDQCHLITTRRVHDSDESSVSIMVKAKFYYAVLLAKRLASWFASRS